MKKEAFIFFGTKNKINTMINRAIAMQSAHRRLSHKAGGM